MFFGESHIYDRPQIWPDFVELIVTETTHADAQFTLRTSFTMSPQWQTKDGYRPRTCGCANGYASCRFHAKWLMSLLHSRTRRHVSAGILPTRRDDFVR